MGLDDTSDAYHPDGDYAICCRLTFQFHIPSSRCVREKFSEIFFCLAI